MMQILISFFKKRVYLLIFFFILAIGIFLRTYQLIERYGFDHDSDLFSWIVKDIVVNQHPRLLGQLTSAPGIFIGSLYYYSLVPFFLLFNMDPVAAAIHITVFGVLTIISYYFVFSKLFNQKIGLIGSFIYAVSIYAIDFDRRVVPSTPTNLWAIWYLFTIFMISKGEFRVLPLLGILIGLIWHIHIALAPTLIVIPIALYFAKKLPTKKQIIIFLLVTFLSSLPLILFETRHNFSQTKSLVGNFTASFGAEDYITESREVILGAANNNAPLNLDPSSKFILEMNPENPTIGSNINLKITTKNPKYSTLIVLTDCGDPEKYEIGSITADFAWSTLGCSEGIHKITATARVIQDPFWKIILGKLIDILDKQNSNIQSLFIFPPQLPEKLQIIVTLIVLSTPFIAWYFKLFSKTQLMIYYIWIAAVFSFFGLSSIIISEYYFASISVILILSISVILHKIYEIKNFGKFLIIFVLLLISIKNFFYFLVDEGYKKGYLERKGVTQFIAGDAKAKEFPCVGINYVTTPGENVGFRYFFYLYNMHIVHSAPDVPIYNIVIPDELALGEVKQKFGHIGVIPPKTVPSKEDLERICQGENTNLTDPLFGYVE